MQHCVRELFQILPRRQTWSDRFFFFLVAYARLSIQHPIQHQQHLSIEGKAAQYVLSWHAVSFAIWPRVTVCSQEISWVKMRLLPLFLAFDRAMRCMIQALSHVLGSVWAFILQPIWFLACVFDLLRLWSARFYSMPPKNARYLCLSCMLKPTTISEP